ncbi:transcriptional regulator [Micromonospora sp. KC723]|nr:transcriptional regulator [Micromonospora sp. KC723]
MESATAGTARQSDDRRNRSAAVRRHRPGLAHRSAARVAIGILVATARGPVRSPELEREVEGISRRMLTLTLRNLERDGLPHRKAHPTVPPREYTATTMALELYESLVALTDRAERHRMAISAAREAYDREHVAGDE